MLQDLDSLAARIGQMVQFTRQLQAERTALQSRLKGVENERDLLRDQLQRHQAEYALMAERVQNQEAEVQALRTQAEAAQATLQGDATRYKAECDIVKQQLTVTQADTSRLRLVADQARTQIDSILMRLPGAPQE
ncbi:MAG TPA: hypothetical protein VL001_01590 [Candidimonas sp.]|nr:hypothetical protein [Candidimonas sp.]